MKALVLAGGLGTRLRPLTHTRPKHLLPIVNKPHIEHVFDLLSRHDVSDVVLLTSYLAEAFDETIGTARGRGLSVEVTHEAEPLGTAGALKNAERLLDDETFLVFNGDILADVDLGALVAFHSDNSAETTILLAPVEDPSVFGVVPTDESGRVEGFIEKPPPGDAPTNLINAGVYVMEPSVLEAIPQGDVWSAERQLFPGLVEAGARLFARAIDGYWMDIGTPTKYLEANLDGLAGRFTTSGVRTEADGVAGRDAATVAPGARLSSVCLGARSRVEERALVERSVLLPGVVVGPGASVEDSILGEGVRVAAGARVRGATVADGEVIMGSEA